MLPPLKVLNDHLDQIILKGKAYPREKVERVYAKLTSPKTSGTFYDANRVRGTIDPDGQVSFKAHYPELSETLGDGWSYKAPADFGVEQTSPKPVRGLIGMQKAFASHLRNPDGSIRSSGSGVYYNQPISEHRATAYSGQGFVEAAPLNIQVLDNRRFTNNPTIAELLLRMDANYQQDGVVQALAKPLIAKHPQLSEVYQQTASRVRAIYDALPADADLWTEQDFTMFDEAQQLKSRF